MSPEHGGRPHLSVVVPAFNEEKRLADSLPRIVRYLERQAVHAEVLVVDDGSTDRTAEVATSLLPPGGGRVLPAAENRGKGHAVRRGVLEARGRWVLMTDADLSTPIEEYDRLATEARDHDLDVVIGSRALAESRVEVAQNAVRQTMGRTFGVLMRLVTGLPYRDTQCGFKLMDRARVEPLFRKMVVDRFAFDVELLFLCHRFGLAVKEVPVTWRNVQASRVHMLTDSANMLFDTLRIRWRFRRGAYNPETTT